MSRPRMQAPTPAAAPGTESTPAIAAHLKNLRQGLSMEIAYHEQRLERLRRMDAGFYEALAKLGQALPDDPVVQAQIRLVQGMDDIRGQVESLETRSARVEEQLTAFIRQMERIVATMEVYTLGVADLGAGLGEQLAGYVASSERARTAEGLCIAGVAESQRNLAQAVADLPSLTANTVSIAVGATLAPVAAEGERIVVYQVPARAVVRESDAHIHIVPEPTTSEGTPLSMPPRRRRTG